MPKILGKWITEIEYLADEQGYPTDDKEIIAVRWYPLTEENAKDYLDLNCEYSTFETEKEAAEDYLQTLANNPQAHRAPYEYQYALDALKAAT